MAPITILDAQANLGDLIHRLGPGQEVVITENDYPVARLVATESAQQPRPIPRLGTQPGSVLYMATDFDAPLDDFKEYME